jgi:hypothetical protein
MSWWLENPLPIVLLGGVTVFILGAIWLQSGHKGMMYAMLAAIVFTATAMLVERTVETDREQVRKTLLDVAGDVERNDLNAVMKHVHPTLTNVRQEAEAEMQRWDFDDVSIKQNLEIVVFPDEQPPRAVAEFNVSVIVTDQSGSMGQQRGLQLARVTFLKVGEEWLVSHYEYERPDLGLKRREQK